MRKHLLFVLLLITLFLISCENRDWINPFDPVCPKELWAPQDFKAEIDANSIKLSWVKTSELISGYKLTKKVDNGTEIDLPDQSKAVTQYFDNYLTGGKVHQYKLIAYAGENINITLTTEITPTTPPIVSTSEASSITSSSAVLSGNIESDGGAVITERGICWSQTYNVSVSDNKIILGNGSGSFTGTITGLSFYTNYYFRAYAINDKGISYGQLVTARTLPTLAEIITLSAISYSSTSFVATTSLRNSGGGILTEVGICWSTSPHPLVTDSKIHIVGWNSYYVNGLIPGTTYYVRAYAITSVGTSYGNEMSVTTLTN